MKKEIYDAYMSNALPAGLDEDFIDKELHITTKFGGDRYLSACRIYYCW